MKIIIKSINEKAKEHPTYSTIELVGDDKKVSLKVGSGHHEVNTEDLMAALKAFTYKPENE